MQEIEVIDNKRFAEVWCQGKLMRSIDKLFYIRHLAEIRACRFLDEFEKLMKEIDEKRALSFVYRLLALRGYMEQELRQKLAEKGVGSQAIETVLAKCRESGYVNDERESALLVEREKRRGKGPLRIKKSLREKAGYISTFNFSAEEEKNQIMQLLEKRFPNLSEIKTKQKAFRFLQSRGFSASIIREIILE